MSVIFVNLKMTICSEIEHDGFLKVYRIAFEMSFPLRSVKIENKHIKKDPWITLGLLTSSRHKAKPFSNKFKHPTEHTISAFKMYNNVFNELKSMLGENKHDMKKNLVHI